MQKPAKAGGRRLLQRPTQDPQTDVNVIYVQLESFIDPKEITDLELSEDAVPTWTRLTEEILLRLPDGAGGCQYRQY